MVSGFAATVNLSKLPSTCLLSSETAWIERDPMRLRTIVERNDTPAGRVFDLVIQALIVLSLVAFSVETLPNLPRGVQHSLGIFEVLVVAVFTAEYLLRLIVARQKLRFVFSFYGLVDLLAILPFYLSLGIDLRSIRVVRLLRLFRAFKLVRYSRAARRYHRALVLVREELILFSVAAAMLLYITAVGIYYFEHETQPEAFASVFHALWWALITLTTVGYGDVYPVTMGGKAFTALVVIVGLGVVAVPTGLVASALSSARAEDEKEGND